MARGPKGEHRPGDPAQAAIAAVQIATEEIAEQSDLPPPFPPPPKDAAPVSLGRYGGLKGGPSRASRLSMQVRNEMAKLGTQARHQEG
jgi:hypothetical protein